MVENTFRVGKTQWSKWNDAGREAYNHSRDLGFTEATAIAEATAKTLKTEEKRRNGKRGLLAKVLDAVEGVQDVAETVTEVAAAVSPVVAIASTVIKATKPHNAKKSK